MNDKLRHLDLFSGIGGFALGLESTGGFETVGFCDNEPFAQKVLKKHWPDVPCYEDVRDVGVDTVGYRGVDIITGGFPCQPFSVAGKQDPNDNRQLWPEMFRIIKEIRPTYVIGENVRNLISIREGVVFEQVCTDLEGEGYEVQTYVLSASSQNAPHQRYRCWIVAYTNSHERQHLCRQKSEQTQKTQQRSGKRGGSQKQNVAHSKSKRQPPLKNRTKIIQSSERQEILCRSGDAARTRLKKDNWTVEPSVGRVAHGIPNRVDRLKGLGNAVVPQIPAALGRAILEVHNG